MEGSEDQNLALVWEVLMTEPYHFKTRTMERGKVWQQIADNLNSIMPSSFLRRNSVVFRETGVIAGSTNVSSNKRSLRYQSSKTSQVFLKDVMELTHESVILSSIVRRALNTTCSTLICSFPAKVVVSSLQAFSANPRFLHRHVQGILRSQM